MLDRFWVATIARITVSHQRRYAAVKQELRDVKNAYQQALDTLRQTHEDLEHLAWQNEQLIQNGSQLLAEETETYLNHPGHPRHRRD
jgi:hypothetical protein